MVKRFYCALVLRGIRTRYPEHMYTGGFVSLRICVHVHASGPRAGHLYSVSC